MKRRRREGVVRLLVDRLEDRRLPAGQVAFTATFDSGLPNEFSASDPTARETASVGGLASFGFGGNFLWNKTGGLTNGTPGRPTVLTLTDLPAHTTLDLEFLFAAIDSWDGRNSCEPCSPPVGPDVFNVTVDDISIFSKDFDNVEGIFQEYVPPPGVQLLRMGRVYGSTNPWDNDSAYNLGNDPAFKGIAHTSDSVRIKWFADGPGWQGSSDESFALDNVQVTLHGVQLPDIVPNSIAITGSNLLFNYEVHKAALPKPAVSQTFWSDNSTYEPGQDVPAHVAVPITGNGTLVGPHAGSIVVDELLAQPPAMRYLLFVADSTNQIDEGPAGELNNVIFLELVQKHCDASSGTIFDEVARLSTYQPIQDTQGGPLELTFGSGSARYTVQTPSAFGTMCEARSSTQEISVQATLRDERRPVGQTQGEAVIRLLNTSVLTVSWYTDGFTYFGYRDRELFEMGNTGPIGWTLPLADLGGELTLDSPFEFVVRRVEERVHEDIKDQLFGVDGRYLILTSIDTSSVSLTSPSGKQITDSPGAVIFPGLPLWFIPYPEIGTYDITVASGQPGMSVNVREGIIGGPIVKERTYDAPIQPGDEPKYHYTVDQLLAGDFDFDQDVNSADLLVFLSNWTGAIDDGFGKKSWVSGDLDGDRDADSADLLIFLSGWTGSN